MLLCLPSLSLSWGKRTCVEATVRVFWLGITDLGASGSAVAVVVSGVVKVVVVDFSSSAVVVVTCSPSDDNS